ncbi:hypothetical protein KC332_g4127 [Hortaea werneckii]|uniref:DUF7708 domain-containing protein n=2 Tax=Hortaea werneckii TaxID=91943 RepID=A0A3M7I8W8_HORWE|nr:hypothetical protein KC358_g4130 [Hortaea werneckii]OTA30670.1 hypothetical protein BTJ68_09421 [Hortaea werneckii EXF-2000]KAI6847429.1 hypothetical protein KC350_g3443 [Hortaea werneckii]KAI6939681.1 hypothetical protein KC341_g4000 [Hortaea werneckii]KAI6942534.1 hypothetical protein KC348_g4430 [Hortaea werneckii]
MEDFTSDHSFSRALNLKVEADQQLEARADQHQREWALFFADADRVSQMTTVPEEIRLLQHSRDLAKAWEKFQRQLPEEHRLPLRGNPPGLSILFESIEQAHKRWQTRRDGTKFGRVKSTFAKVARSMDDHSQILDVLPNNDKYVSLITGSMACIVKATINHEDIALALTDSLEQLCEDIMHWKKQVLAHPDLPSIQKDVQELYVVVFQYLTDIFTSWSRSGLKRFSLSFDKNAMTKLFSTRQAQIDRLSERIDRAAKLHEQKSIQAILASVVTKAELEDALLKLGCRMQTYLEGLDLRRRPQRSSYSDSSPPLLLTAPEEQRLEDDQPQVHVYQVDKQEIIHQIPDFERLLNLPVNDAKNHSHRATHLETDSRVVLKLHDWLDGAVGSNLWIQGPAHVPSPSQNTLTAMSLMIALQSGRRPVLSFFCDTIRTAQLSPQQILSELVHCFIAQLVPYLPSVIRSDLDLSPPRFSAACKQDCPIEDTLALLRDIVTSMESPIYILIDGTQAVERRADEEHTRDLSCMVEYLCGTDVEGQRKSSANKVCFTSDGFVDALALQVQRRQLEKVSFELESDDLQADDVAGLRPSTLSCDD